MAFIKQAVKCDTVKTTESNVCQSLTVFNVRIEA